MVTVGFQNSLRSLRIICTLLFTYKLSELPITWSPAHPALRDRWLCHGVWERGEQCLWRVSQMLNYSENNNLYSLSSYYVLSIGQLWKTSIILFIWQVKKLRLGEVKYLVWFFSFLEGTMKTGQKIRVLNWKPFHLWSCLRVWMF